MLTKLLSIKKSTIWMVNFKTFGHESPTIHQTCLNLFLWFRIMIYCSSRFKVSKHDATVLLTYTNWITLKYSSSPTSFRTFCSFLILHNFKCTILMNLLFQFYLLTLLSWRYLSLWLFCFNSSKTYAMKDILSRCQRSWV